MRYPVVALALALAVPLALPAPAEAQLPQTRKGFWANIGMGAGSLGCDRCTSRDTAWSGGTSLGWTLSEHWLLGAGTTGWNKEADGATLAFGTLAVMVRNYPVVESGFFLQAGVGRGWAYEDVPGHGSGGDSGVGALLGLGYDIRVLRPLSLSPYLNHVVIILDNIRADYLQFGLGLTLH